MAKMIKVLIGLVVSRSLVLVGYVLTKLICFDFCQCSTATKSLWWATAAAANAFYTGTRWSEIHGVSLGLFYNGLAEKSNGFVSPDLSWLCVHWPWALGLWWYENHQSVVWIWWNRALPRFHGFERSNLPDCRFNLGFPFPRHIRKQRQSWVEPWTASSVDWRIVKKWSSPGWWPSQAHWLPLWWPSFIAIF